MGAEEVRRTIDRLQEQLNRAQLDARRFIDSVTDMLDSVILDALDRANLHLDIAKNDAVILLDDALDGAYRSTKEAEDQMIRLFSEIQQRVDSALVEVAGYVSSAYESAIQQVSSRLEAEIFEINDTIQALTGQSEALISSAASTARSESAGALDWVAKMLDRATGGLISDIIAIVQAIGDLVDPLILGLANLFRPFFQSLKELLTFDAEEIVKSQIALVEAWKRQLEG